MRDSTRALQWAVTLAVVTGALVSAPMLGQTAVLDITGATVIEGDAGTSTVTFTVVCDPCDRVNAIVNWSTMDGTATASDNDYVAKSGQIDDLGNGTAVETYPIAVTVNGDTVVEGDETFSLKVTSASVGCPSLGGPGGCSTPPTAAVATATIENDDSTQDPPEEEPDEEGQGCALWLFLLILLLLLILALYLRSKRGRS